MPVPRRDGYGFGPNTEINKRQKEAAGAPSPEAGSRRGLDNCGEAAVRRQAGSGRGLPESTDRAIGGAAATGAARGSMVTIKPPPRTPPKKNRMDNTQSSFGSIGSATSSLMDLTSRGAKADEAGVAQAAMAADAERQEVEERQRALSGDLGQDESDGEDVNFVVEHPPLADTNRT